MNVEIGLFKKTNLTKAGTANAHPYRIPITASERVNVDANVITRLRVIASHAIPLDLNARARARM